jgi:polyhydroxyalkanoate synthesis regulator phasin
MNTPTSSRTAAAAEGRNADSARRRQRVITAINQATADGAEISVAGIARAACVDRSFLYRHRDLLEQLHAGQAQPGAAAGTGPRVSHASLQADLLAAHERASRQAARVHQLEKRLSQLLGEHAWRESGLGAPDDIDALKQRIAGLEQQVADLRLQLDERGDELAAARAANRELMLRANQRQ